MAQELVWFFGYGSLMWNPGFPLDAFEPARLDGYHRRFCIVSRHYRGTAEQPGLVLGLAPGGQCVGRAIGVAPAREEEVLRYLDDREFVGGIYVYERLLLPLRLLPDEQVVQGWCYVARPEHPDYAGGLGDTAVLERVARAKGLAGSNREYVLNTVTHLREMAIGEPDLEALATALRHPDPEPGAA
jgi:glutathione-specific gamma-glutamylcyclotransferase